MSKLNIKLSNGTVKQVERTGLNSAELDQLQDLLQRFETGLKKDCCGKVWSLGLDMSRSVLNDARSIVESQINYNNQ